MLLDETCELLFQMHKKNNNYQVVWTKSIYPDKPNDLDAAKELLLRKNIIYSRQSASSRELTFLNPEVYEARSFNEAMSIFTRQAQLPDLPSEGAQMRQLAVILFADIEGYTRLMQHDETLAVVLCEKFKKVLENKILLHHGRLHQWTGDGALCSFTSSVEAVHAAIETQKQMLTEPLVPLRIGIHGGDVLVKKNDLYGDGVNIASRIQSFAVPGSVLISKKIFDDIKNQKDIEAVSLGKYKLKNVREAVEIFGISNKGMIVPSPRKLEGKGSAVSHKKLWLLSVFLLMLLALTVWIWFKFFNTAKLSSTSIAVLPFVDMSANKDQEYFGDGLSEELLSHLAKIPNLKVIARTSSFSFKGKNEDLRTIGEKLGVSTILEGSVRKSGNKIRITAQLNNAKDGTHIWSETYERTFDDIFKIQDEISIAVVQHLKSALLKGATFDEYGGNPEAYNLMLQARFLIGLGNEDSTYKAIQLYKKALVVDSNDARLWASLSQAYALLSGSNYLGKADGIIKARQAVEKALSINPNLPEAYIARGRIRQLYDWDWKGADQDYQKAFDLYPHDPVILHRKASLARTLGNVDSAIFLYRKAIELDPLSAVTFNSFSITLMNANRLDEAIQKSKRILEMKPQFAGCHAFISGVYLLQSKRDSAYIELQKEIDEEWRLAALAMLYNIPERKTEAKAAMKELMMNYPDDWAYQIAQAFAWNGDIDQAFFWLERAYTNRDGGLAEIKGNPFFRNIKNDPRYLAFMKKMGLA